MGLFRSTCILLALLVCAMGGWFADYRTLVGLAALLTLAAGASPLALKNGARSGWSSYFLGILAVGFFWLSRAGAPSNPSLGSVGFIALHGLILGGYGVFLLALLRRTSREERMDEDFMTLDLWLLNLGLVFFAAFWLVGVMRSGIAVSPVLGALRRAILPLSLLAFFTLLMKHSRTAGQRRFTTVVLTAALLLSVALGTVRFLRVRASLGAAALALASGENDDGLEDVERAMALNRPLQWSPFERRAGELNRNLYAAKGQYDLALEEMHRQLLSRLAETPAERTREWVDGYSEAKPLELILRKFSSADQRGELATLRAQWDLDPADRESLLLLLLQNGFIDRLSELYAWSGFPEMGNPEAYELALERFIRNYPEADVEADFFLGLVFFRTERFREAERSFRRALDARPDHHNAIVYLERIALEQGRFDRLAALRRRKRRITPSMTFGNHESDLKLDDVLWAPFEANRGRYRIELEVRGQSALGERPQLSVYLTDSEKPVFRGPIESEQWTRISFESQFDEEGTHRLMMVFENDFFEENEDVATDRCLEFRLAEVTFRPNK